MKKQFILITTTVFVVLFSINVKANLLSNSGFEAGLTDWSSTGNATIRAGDPLAFEGTNYIYGSNTALFNIWQDVDLLGQGIQSTEIDTGNLVIDFGGWQSGWMTQQDNGQIFIRMLDVSMGNIGNVSLPSFFSNHTWVEQSGSASLLSGTRFLRFEFIGTRVSGSNNDAFLDATYLDISRSTSVPNPVTLMLLGLGLIGLFINNNRQKIWS